MCEQYRPKHVFIPCFFCQSHYSLLKGAAFMGIGTNNVIKVKTDEW